MRSLLLKLLEGIGRIRLPMIRFKTKMVVGLPDTPDFRGTFDWRDYLDARALSAVWGPRPESPWLPFHCITLFAAVDYLKHDTVGPCETDPWPIAAYAHPDWIDASTLLLVDLPGPASAALGAALGANGCDLVCTFNNWPHPKGVIRPHETLAALLRYASWLSQKRTVPSAPGPAAWLCDADRLNAKKGKPGEFDNRYYIEDAILPGPRYLSDRGITSVIYVGRNADKVGADLGVYLRSLQKDGIRVLQVLAAEDGALSTPEPYALPARSFSTMGFFRSSAGGFGAPVPHPSSGG
jgi:hypothetical protein